MLSASQLAERGRQDAEERRDGGRREKPSGVPNPGSCLNGGLPASLLFFHLGIGADKFPLLNTLVYVECLQLAIKIILKYFSLSFLHFFRRPLVGWGDIIQSLKSKVKCDPKFLEQIKV